MSRSHLPTDSQALLQSMLQKLNLQTGIDGQAHLQTPAPAAAASTVGQDGARGASNLQNNPGNMFGFNDSPSKKFTTPTANLKQQPGERGRSQTSFLSQNVGTEGQMGWSRVLRLDTQTGFDPKETGPSLPTKSSKDISNSFFKRSYSERVIFDSSAMTNHIPPYTRTVSSASLNQSPVQGFTGGWSHTGTAGEDKTVLHMENGGFGGLKQSSEVQSFSGTQITTNSRKKQRSSENKTRRWTQRIKERWKEKHGKKEKEDRRTEDQRTEKEAQISNPDQVMMAGSFMNTPNNHGETTLLSMDSGSPNKMFPAQTEDNTRQSTDFDIGLGSFSLLEEIIRGQEWGKFINPNLPTTPVHPRPSEETLSQPKIQPNPYSTNQSPRALSLHGGGTSRWSFSTESSLTPACSTGQTTPGVPSVGMDVSERKQPIVYRESNQSELMEEGRNQLDMQSRGNGPGLQHRPSASSESGDSLYKAVLKVRGQTSRKRHHQPVDNRDERVQKERRSDGEEAGRVSAGSLSSAFPPSSNMMEESTESQQENVTPFHPPLSPPLSPSSSNPFAPAPRGVLKHSVSQESEASVETLTKKRRVEENRRVHFSEQVVAIESPSLDLDFTDSEEDSGEEEDSLTELECEVGPAAAEEVLQARRPALPAWIKALKRMNAGKKHR